MPQFDQTSFFNQVFWFIFIFLNFYFFIIYYFLPVLNKNLKLVSKKLKQNNTNFFLINPEKFNENNKLILLCQIFYENLNFLIEKYKQNFINHSNKNNIFREFKFYKNIVQFYNNIYPHIKTYKNI